LPKEKLQTRWEKFAAAKGIQKKRKTKAKYDEDSGEWRSAYGYGSKKNDDLNDWIIEVPKNADPFEDQYEKKRLENVEKLGRNKKQQRRNEAEASGTALQKSTSTPDIKAMKKKELNKQLIVTKTSTASIGKFDKKISGEKKLKDGKRRKFAPVAGERDEQKKDMMIAQRVTK
ncbi:Rhodanese- sulfurtransferase, partial [Nowakowskiella sp. JEL0078]